MRSSGIIKNGEITTQTLQSQSAKITLEKYNFIFSSSLGVHLPGITVTKLFLCRDAS